MNKFRIKIFMYKVNYTPIIKKPRHLVISVPSFDIIFNSGYIEVKYF